MLSPKELHITQKVNSPARNADLTANTWCIKLFEINNDFNLPTIAPHVTAISGSNTLFPAISKQGTH